MPAGWPYFAWVDASETVFGPEHLRWDEQVFSFKLAQEEGDPATLTAVVRRPRNVAGDPIGLLGPGRKIWAWFALDCGPDLIKFRGRLVGIPTSLFEELVTLEFVARPVDLVAQKEALADTLRVLPYYDPVVLDPARRTDPDVVLEGYTKVWHFDRETHVVTVSDEIDGEDGLVEFLCANGDVFYDGLGLTLTTGPLTRVDVSAEYTWTQSGYGTVDLTRYLLSHWPGAHGKSIASFTMEASDWPKTGATIGDGWIAVAASAHNFYDFSKTATETLSGSVILKGADGDETARAQSTRTSTAPIDVGAIFIPSGEDTYTAENHASYDNDGNVTSASGNSSSSVSAFAMQIFSPTLVAGWKAERHCTEKVSFSLVADIQPILTDPVDGEALRIDDIRSVNLSDSNEGVPIENPLRRSYIATGRGNQSIEHLIAYARAHLMKRARVVEIAFAPKLARMPEVTLRKNAFLTEPRVGEATGKIIGYSIALDGSDGQPKCEVKIGCMIGYGGTVAAADGDPTYCTIDYAGADYQVFVNRTVVLPFDTSVGYQPPIAEPNDDGLDLLSALRAEDVFDQPLVVKFGHEEQGSALKEMLAPWGQTGVQEGDNVGTELQAKNLGLRTSVADLETHATFKLKSMTREFTTEYTIQVSDLKIPTGYDLEAT